MKVFRGGGAIVPLVVLALVLSGTAALAVAPANIFLQRTWERTDRPVADGVVNRTWMWGPAAFAEAMTEPYLESPNGQRSVQYFDKSRMEISDPGGDPASAWHVTNGLLVVEMVSGRVQVGDNTFEESSPAEVNVGGDSGDPNGPTYLTIGTLLDVEPHDDGTIITSRIDRAGGTSVDPALEVHGVSAGELVPETGHRVASVFQEFMQSTGTVYQGGDFIEDRLFQNPFYATGFPITEAYWSTVQIAGTPTDVLLQCFERRCLTYTPGNPAGWQVEAGNVGRHYFEWRHGQIATPQAGDIRVVDVFYNPDTDNDRSGEYVTIRSFDPYPVDLSGWTLTDDGPNAVFTFPEFVLQPGASVQIQTCDGTNSATVIYTGRCSAWWSNGGDTAYLHDATGGLVSEFGY